MAQDYYPINEEEDICDMIPKMYKNLESVISSFSGVDFPKDNLFVGMTCYRTDLKKTYRYNGVVWAVDIPEIATNEETLAGLDDSKMMTPKKVKQVVEDNKLLIATTEEALDGENNKKVMTPKTVKEVVEDNKLEIASSLDAITGLNDTKAMTPKKVKDSIQNNIYSMPIGSIYYAIRTDTPEGSARLDGSEYTKELFPDFYADLASGKYPSVSYEQYASQLDANENNCGLFALDEVNSKFKMPIISDSTIIASVKDGAIGEYFKQDISNIEGNSKEQKHILYPLFIVVFNISKITSTAEYDKFITAVEGKIDLETLTEKLKEKADVDLANVTTRVGTINVQYFTTAGTHSFAVPKGVEKIRVTCVGGAGGGGGGNQGAGGGNGATGYYNQKVLSVTPESIHTVTVGSGGGGGYAVWEFSYSPYGTAGGTGGVSSFGNLLSASGGGGGGGAYRYMAGEDWAYAGGGSSSSLFVGRYGLFQEYSIGGAGGGVRGSGAVGTSGTVVVEW